MGLKWTSFFFPWIWFSFFFLVIPKFLRVVFLAAIVLQFWDQCWSVIHNKPFCCTCDMESFIVTKKLSIFVVWQKIRLLISNIFSLFKFPPTFKFFSMVVFDALYPNLHVEDYILLIGSVFCIIHFYYMSLYIRNSIFHSSLKIIFLSLSCVNC